MKQKYELTEADIALIVLGSNSSSLDADEGTAWRILGKKYGFLPDTIEAVDEGKVVMAEPVAVDDTDDETRAREGYNDIDREGEQATDSMFDTDDSTAITQIGEMAERLAVEMDAVDKLYKEHSRRKEALDAGKEQLNRALTEAGMDSCKLACGLTPRTRVNERIFKAAGVDDDSLLSWLRDHGLGDIIKETVHHGTLTSTMKEHRNMGNELPESMFQVSLRPTITMGGKSAYLAAKGDG